MEVVSTLIDFQINYLCDRWATCGVGGGGVRGGDGLDVDEWRVMAHSALCPKVAVLHRVELPERSPT